MGCGRSQLLLATEVHPEGVKLGLRQLLFLDSPPARPYRTVPARIGTRPNGGAGRAGGKDKNPTPFYVIMECMDHVNALRHIVTPARQAFGRGRCTPKLIILTTLKSLNIN